MKLMLSFNRQEMSIYRNGIDPRPYSHGNRRLNEDAPNADYPAGIPALRSQVFAL